MTTENSLNKQDRQLVKSLTPYQASQFDRLERLLDMQDRWREISTNNRLSVIVKYDSSSKAEDKIEVNAQMLKGVSRMINGIKMYLAFDEIGGQLFPNLVRRKMMRDL